MAFDRSTLAYVDDIPSAAPPRNSFSRRTLLALAVLAFFAVCYSATQPEAPKEIPIRDAHGQPAPAYAQTLGGQVADGPAPSQHRPDVDSQTLRNAKILAPTHPEPILDYVANAPVAKSVYEPPLVPSDRETAPPNSEFPVPKSPPFDKPSAPHIFWQTIFPALSWFFLWPFRFAFGIIYSLLSTCLIRPLAGIFRTVKFFAITVPFSILSAVSPALTFLSMAALMGALLGGTASWMSEGIAKLVCGERKELQNVEGAVEEEDPYRGDRIKGNIRKDNSHVTDRGAISFEEGWGTSEDEDSFDEDSFSELDVGNGSRNGPMQKTAKLNLSDRVRAAEKGRQAARKRAVIIEQTQTSDVPSTTTTKFGIKPRHGTHERGSSPDTNADGTLTMPYRPTSSNSNGRKLTPVKKDGEYLEPSRRSHPVDSSALRRVDNVKSRKHKKFNPKFYASAEL